MEWLPRWSSRRMISHVDCQPKFVGSIPAVLANLLLATSLLVHPSYIFNYVLNEGLVKLITQYG